MGGGSVRISIIFYGTSWGWRGEISKHIEGNEF